MACATGIQQQRQQQLQQNGLQRQHLEVAIIFLSGCRLCASLLCTRHPDVIPSVVALALVHILSLWLEFGFKSIGSNHRLRKSASHGIAQGILAVPSVLAALVVVAPEDGWQSWLQGSCSAAVAIMGLMYRQALSATTAVNAIHSSQTQHCSEAGSGAAQSKQDQDKQQWLRSATVTSGVTLTGVVCVVAVAVAVAGKTHWLRELLQLFRLPDSRESHAWLHPALQILIWAGSAMFSFNTSLQLLPGCFSLGEAALMAQAAACLTISTAGAAKAAVLFVPAVVCRHCSHTLLAQVQHLGGCTAAAHTTALSLHLLPAVVSLVLAAAVASCLMLWVLHRSLQQLQQLLLCRQHGCAAVGKQAPLSQETSNGSSRVSSNSGAVDSLLQKAAAGVDKCNGAHLGNNSNAEASNSCNSKGGTGQATTAVAAALAVSCVAAAAAAAAGVCVLLLWLCAAALWTLGDFLPAEPGRVSVLLYWVGLLVVTLPALKWYARGGSMPQIIVRKVYHLLAIGLFVPVFFWDMQLLALSLAIAFAALVLLEVLRCLKLPVLGQAVQNFMQEFVDERDGGVIYITHFTLLLGLAVPVWLCLVLPVARDLLPTSAGLHAVAGQEATAAAAGARGCADGIKACSGHGSSSIGSSLTGASTAAAVLGRSRVEWLDPSAALLQVTAGLSGLVIIGVGDTAASFVGKLFGRVPVHAGSSKTVEGTLAGILGSLAAWVLLLWAIQLLPTTWTSAGWWVQLITSTAGAGLMEAATSQLDNILLPLWYLPHLLPV